MSRLLPKAANDFYGEPFNKKNIIQEIKEMLLKLEHPWVWYTINDCMDTYGKPNYDLVLIRNKVVTEEIRFNGNPFSSIKSITNNLYSIVLGIHVVDKFMSQKSFEITEEFSTASVEVKSAVMLYELIKEIDTKAGGIRHDS